jgi:catechol 2,3-dioxygenase-like lactoylglutathione lyase family enzyme
VLGRFLEFSIATPDIQASLNFYGKLGFSETEVGEAWPHPYAVLTDGRVCVGLHQLQDALAPAITFVKPQLLSYLSDLEKLGVEFEFRRLGNDVFNEVAWLDPSRHLIRLVEARTFSPSKRRNTDTSLCGYFLEIALPTPNRDFAKTYWEQLGFVGMDEPDAMLPHVSCTSDTIDVGLYDPAYLPRPTLRFDCGNLAETLARLAAVGISPAAQMPAPLRQAPVALVLAPEGTPILLSSQ